LAVGISSAALVLILYTPIFIYSGIAKVFANQWVLPEGWQGYVASIPSHMLSVWKQWMASSSMVWAVILGLGFILALVFHRRFSRVRFPTQVAAFLWVVGLLLYQRPSIDPKIMVFLQALFCIWCAAGIIGLLRGIRLKFIHNLPISAIVLAIAILPFTVTAIQILPTIAQRWSSKGPEEEAVLFIKNQIEPNDLIIIDAPFDAALWYYSLYYGVGDTSRFDKRRPFDHLYVIVSPDSDQTLETVIKSRGPDMVLVNEQAAKFLINFSRLEIYRVPHR
jgi:hypothetical protein